MNKVKMKVKTMIWIFIGLLFLVFRVIPFVNIELANNLSDSKPEIAEKLYDNYLRYPTKFRKDEALYKSSENIMGGFGRYNIMMWGKGGNKLLDYGSVMDAIENNEKIINDYPKSSYYHLAYKSILDSYIYLGDSNNLEKWIEWGLSTNREEVKKLSYLYKAYIHFANGEYNMATEILQKYSLGNEEMDYIYYFINGHIEFAKEEFEKASEYYKKASNMDWHHKVNFFGNYAPYGRNEWLNELKYNKGDNKIRGRITVEGLGIPFVEIYLQYPNQGYSSRGGDFIAITDKDGYFETIGIKDGRYKIGIGIGAPIILDKVYLEKGISYIDLSEDVEFNFEFISRMKIISPKVSEIVEDDKFTMEWQNIEGADYYTVYTNGFDDSKKMKGSSVTFAIEDENRELKIKDNKAIFDLEILKNRPAGTTYSMEDETINPQAIMGYFHTGAEMILIVNAYDKDGNLLNSSLPLTPHYDNVPSIKIENGKLTEGEKLILSKKYEDSIRYYENILSTDKDNKEALRYLSRIHMINWKKDKKDMLKAIDYGITLYKIDDDAEILERILGGMDSDDYRKYRNNVEEILAVIPKGKMTTEFYSNRGMYYRAIGEFEKAIKDLLIDKDEFLDPDITYMDIYLGEDMALDRLRNEDIKFYLINKEKLINGIEGLSKLDKNNEDYKTFKEYLYSLLKREGDYDERRKEFNKIYSNIKDPSIRTILHEIKVDYMWE